MILVLLLFSGMLREVQASVHAHENCICFSDFPQILSYVKIKVRRQIVAPVLALAFCIQTVTFPFWSNFMAGQKR